MSVERQIGVAGASAAYHEAGDGPPLVLLPSVFLRARTYAPTLRALARDFRVLAVEMPGSGASARLSRPWTFPEYADWVAQFLSAAGVARAAVVGHSHAGAVAAHLAVRHPGRVAALVLADAVGAPGGSSWPRLVGGRLVDLALEPGFCARAGPDVASNVRAHTRNFFAQLGACRRAELSHEAARISAPTLVSWGASDHTTGHAGATRFRDRIAGARLDVGPGSHDRLVTHADDFAGAVARFWKALGPSAGSGRAESA